MSANPDLRDAPEVRYTPIARIGATSEATAAHFVESGGRKWHHDARKRRLLAGADVLTAVAAALALDLVDGYGASRVIYVAGLAVSAVVLAKLLGLYDRDNRVLWHTTADELAPIATWSMLVAGVDVLFAQAASSLLPSTPMLITFVVVLFAVDVGLRGAARTLWRQTTPPERVVIVGSGDLERALRRKFEIFPDLHFELVGSIDAYGPPGVHDARGDDRTIEHLRELRSGVDRVLIATTTVNEHLIAELVPYCRAHEIKLGIVPQARGMFGTAVVLDHFADLPIVQYNTWETSRTSMMLKRAMDIAVSGACLLVLLPFLPFAALAIRLDSPGPVFFRQPRAGKGGVPFTMLKLRTMQVDAEARLRELVDVRSLATPVFKLESDPRITRLGQWLRRGSFDELPQLWNVLRGHMSLVGPRPEQLDLVAQYSPSVREVRLAIRPGLTGPMQIYGRGALSFDERVAVEREYVENLSLGADLRVIGRTVSAVARGRGAT